MAGSVTEASEQHAVLDAFSQVCSVEAWVRHLQGQAAHPGHDAQYIRAILAHARGAADRSMTALLASSAWEQLAPQGNGFTAASE